MYVAVKGGEKAIAEAHRLLAEERRGDVSVPELSLSQIKNQMRLAVARVMSEGSLYSEDLAAIAIKQAQGDLQEAVFLLRAYRTTLPRFGVSDPMDTSEMILDRRISATWKDLPGGQVLGATYDYTHRLLDLSLAGEGGAKAQDELLPDEAAETPPSAGTLSPTDVTACLPAICREPWPCLPARDSSSPWRIPARRTRTSPVIPLSFPATGRRTDPCAFRCSPALMRASS